MGTLSTFLISNESGVSAITPKIERVKPVVLLDIVGNLESMVEYGKNKNNEARYLVQPSVNLHSIQNEQGY